MLTLEVYNLLPLKLGIYKHKQLLYSETLQDINPCSTAKYFSGAFLDKSFNFVSCFSYMVIVTLEKLAKYISYFGQNVENTPHHPLPGMYILNDIILRWSWFPIYLLLKHYV